MLTSLRRSTVLATQWLIAVFLGLHSLAQGQIYQEEAVVWKDLVGMTSSGPGSLSKSSTTAGWNADAVSSKWIFGDGYVKFKFATNNKGAMVGLADLNSDRDWTSLDHTIYGKADGTWDIREAGATIAVASDGTYTTSDEFKIERSGTMIRYYKNGVLKYVSRKRVQGPLLVDTSFTNQGAAISNCVYFGLPEVEDVLWRGMIGTTATYTTGGQGSTLEKSAATSVEDADAVSFKAMAGDGALSFRFGQINKTVTLGLTDSNADRLTNSIKYALKAVASSGVAVMESGVQKAFVSLYTAGDVFSIERTGTTVRYYRTYDDGTNTVKSLLYTSTASSTENLFVDSSFSTSGALVTNCQLSNAVLAEPVIWINPTAATFAFSSTGSTLTRNSGSGNWSSGAFGSKWFAGNGLLSFRFASNASEAAVGLSDSRSSAIGLSVLDYAIVGKANGQIEIFESNVSQGLFGSYTSADQFQIRRVGTAIQYVRNGVTLRTANVAATVPLSPGAALYSATAAVSVFQQYGGPDDLVWRNQAGTTPTAPSPGEGSVLTRGSAAVGWTADAQSVQTLVGDGYVQWRFGQTNKDAMLALTPSDKNGSYTDLAYTIYGKGGVSPAQLKIFENGATMTTIAGGYTSTDVFRVRRTGSTITYCRLDANGAEQVLWTTTNALTIPLVVDCTLNDAGVQLLDCQIFNGDGDSDGINDSWEAENGLNPNSAADATLDSDNDGVNNVGEFFAATDPRDYFNGTPATLAIYSGDHFYGKPGSYITPPLQVQVTRPSGSAANVPVVFTVVSGGAEISGQSGTGANAGPITVWTDSLGRAAVYVKLPNQAGVNCVIQAQAGANAGLSNAVNLTVHTHLLRASYAMDEADGVSAVYDSSLSGNNGTLSNMTRVVNFMNPANTANRALQSGTNGRVQVSNAPSLAFSSAAFSAVALIRPTPGSNLKTDGAIYPIISKWNSTGGGFELALRGTGTGTNLIFQIYNNGTVVKEISKSLYYANSDSPHLVAFLRNQNGLGSLFIDWENVTFFNSLSMPNSLTSTADLLLASNNAGRTFPGTIDDDFLYESTLRFDELKAIVDSDGDYMLDWWERKYFGDLSQGYNGDYDSDGLVNGGEYVEGTKPNVWDTDGDGIPDGWERNWGFDPTTPNPDDDWDNDGLSNLKEYQAGTYPNTSDSDGDGASDGWEYDHGLNPTDPNDGNRDSDGDGVSDYTEALQGTPLWDYFNNAYVELEIVGPSERWVKVKPLAIVPLTVKVKGDLVGTSVPMNFKIVGGAKLLESATSTTPLTTLTAWSNPATNQVTVYVQQLAAPAADASVTITPGPEGSVTPIPPIYFSLRLHQIAARWEMDEVSGAIVADSSTTVPPNHGTLTGGTRVAGLDYSNPSTNRAIAFDGFGDVVTIPNATALGPNGAKSISAWFQLADGLQLNSSTQYFPIASKWTEGLGAWELAVSGDTASRGIQFRMRALGSEFEEPTEVELLIPDVDLRSTLADGRPHLVVVVCDQNGLVSLYVDGAVVGTLQSLSFGWAPPYNNASLKLGANSAGKYFPGILDDISIYSTARTPEDIQDEFDSDDELPDWWERKYFGGLTKLASGDEDSDGFTNFQEYTHGSDPSLAQPVLAIYSGNNQSSAAHTFLTQPLVVQVVDSNAEPLTGYPVVFTANSGALLTDDRRPGSPLTSSLTVYTLANGCATVHCYAPTTPGLFALSAAGTGANITHPANFEGTVTTETPPPPVAPSNVIERRIDWRTTEWTWEDNSDNETEFIIERQQPNGEWVELGRVSPNQTTFRYTQPE